MPENLPILWTTWCQYYATGEGVTSMARIALARDEAQCRQEFSNKFGEFWAAICEAAPGVVRNEVTEQLFADRMFELMGRMKDAGAIEAQAQYHFNLS